MKGRGTGDRGLGTGDGGAPIAVRYVAEANPEGRWLPGVPLADMDSQTFMALPVWLRRSVMACPFYEVEAEVKAEAEAEVKG